MSETLAGTAEYTLEVNRSRFVALAMPVHDVDQAVGILRAHRIADAHHNAWAWRIGNAYRFNDDGEVGGTAGRPILAAIDGQGLDRVVVRVARWIGGIRLGTGGLVRAYGGCATECLRNAPRQPIVARVTVPVLLDFAQEQPVRNALPGLGAVLAGQTYREDGLLLELSVAADAAGRLRAALTDLCRGRLRFPDSTPQS